MPRGIVPSGYILEGNFRNKKKSNESDFELRTQLASHISLPCYNMLHLVIKYVTFDCHWKKKKDKRGLKYSSCAKVFAYVHQAVLADYILSLFYFCSFELSINKKGMICMRDQEMILLTTIGK